MYLSNSERMRRADRLATERFGIPSIRLMETASAHLGRAAMALAPAGSTIWAFCGSGNNGGDGIGAAVFLLSRGWDVRVLLTGSRERMTPDSREMARRLESRGGRVEEFDPEEPDMGGKLARAGAVIDALFGIGLNKPVGGRALEAIRLINASGVPVISADIASGVEADTGRILGEAVRAAETVTFSLAKPGHFAEPGCTCRGRLTVADIGIPAEVLAESRINVQAVEDGEVRLPARPPVSHKGNYGRLLILAGHLGYTGAPSLCARAAVRAGAGLVHLGVPASIYGITAVKNDEAMPFPLADDGEGGVSAGALPVLDEKRKNCDVCVLGPGLGRGEGTVELCRELLLRAETPVVVDADGLYALSRDMELLRRVKDPGRLVLTPHEGEFLRLGGRLTGDRIGDARDFAARWGCVLVLKGHRTLAAFPDGEVYITTHGNPGMAKGGTGDVLAGVLGAMLGQLPFQQAVVTGLQLHALAGDLCRDRLGEYAMTASDIIETLPEATRLLRE